MSNNIVESDNACSFEGELSDADMSQDNADAGAFAVPAVPVAPAKPDAPESILKLFFETSLQIKLAENQKLKAANAELEKTYKELLNKKYALLCQMNMPPDVNASNLLPTVTYLKEKQQQMLDRMHNVLNADKEISAAYAAHCEEVINTQKNDPQPAKYDEYTVMPYHELLKCKEELDRKVEETRAKCQSMSEELKAKEKEYEDEYNNIMQEAETFQQYEMEALEALELAKFEVEKRKISANYQ